MTLEGSYYYYIIVAIPNIIQTPYAVTAVFLACLPALFPEPQPNWTHCLLFKFRSSSLFILVCGFSRLGMLFYLKCTPFSKLISNILPPPGLFPYLLAKIIFSFNYYRYSCTTFMRFPSDFVHQSFFCKNAHLPREWVSWCWRQCLALSTQDTFAQGMSYG